MNLVGLKLNPVRDKSSPIGDKFILVKSKPELYESDLDVCESRRLILITYTSI
ncbi:hypothetical protein FACS1894200_09940 [Spirochaetia bacterium]|nr:hypothetical protein FACS1894200_09940 [Spirochaetia bacterium]